MEDGQIKGYISGIVAVVLMGFSFFFSKIVLNELNNDVFKLLSYRFLISLLGILILKMFKFIELEYSGKRIKRLLLICLIQPVAYFIAENLGLSMITSSEAGLIMSLLPVVTIVLSMIFLKEKINVRQGIYMIISIGGALFINIMGYVPGNSSNLGRLIVFLAVVLGSIYGIMTRDIAEEFSPIERTAAMMLVGAISFTLVSLIKNIYLGTLDSYILDFFNLKILLPLSYLGLISSLLAMYLMNIAYTNLEVSKVSIISNGMILVSLFAGVVILRENLYWYHTIGSIAIILGALGASR